MTSSHAANRALFDQLYGGMALICLLALLGFGGCGDDGDAGDGAPSTAAADGAGDGGTLGDGATGGDAGADEDGAAASDVVGALDAAVQDAAGAAMDAAAVEDAGVDGLGEDVAKEDGGEAGSAGDANGEDGSGAGDASSSSDGAGGNATSDGSASDGSASDGSSGDGGTAPDPCGTCPVDKQPKGKHPGATGSCTLLSPKEIAYGSGFGQGYKKMLVFRPTCAGGHPVLFFVHEQSIYNAGGFVGKFGEGYKKLLQHLASRGTIAVFVRVQSGLLDGDHDRMAKDLLTASKVLFDSVSVALKDEVAYAGHGVGAKVAILAAVRTYTKDPKNEWSNPRAVLAFGVRNEKTLLTSNYTDASIVVKQIPSDADVAFTFVQAHGDTKAPYTDPKKPNAVAIYDGLKVARKQIIVLHGTGKGDKNPPTSPELHDDHSAPLTLIGKPGGATDFTNKASYLDALDWYGYWKITAGAMDFHFGGGDKKWAYGDLRTHGGTMPNGKVVTHEVLKEQWK
ncbi:MAG: hypothetical protein KC502_21635 [Myxococcales bacterium]|nr:hypothetical protein [Myxococcales bacterium]